MINIQKCTEEYGGISGLMNPNSPLDYETVTDYFNLDNNYSPWVRIRECNDMIEGVIGSESLTERQKQLLLGQAFFLPCMALLFNGNDVWWCTYY